ncbi:DUF6591 domain-containing protein [Ileibacterium valens]|uniref:DUF6591 domain-containing protein n=1 Tax=Ileibacterium valens TaxID=1862668 RepID=UPI0025733E27|nr:DUF6591 domain-containing protein [Ileibacterium valens]
MTNSKYRFKKPAAVGMSVLIASLTLAGCFAKDEKAEKEDPITTICGSFVEENGSNPAYIYTKSTFDSDQATSQLIKYFYDEGWSDEQIHSSFDDIEEIVRDGDQLILIGKTETYKLDSSIGNQKNLKDYQTSILQKFGEVSQNSACDISEETAVEQAKEAVAKRKQTVDSRKQQEKQKEKEEQERQQAEAQSNTQAAGIRPEFQKSMDEFIAFCQQYAEFMKNYQNSDDIASMMTEYASMMSQYTKVAEAMDQVDESALSPEELQLYIETTTEIQKILASVY